MRQLNLIILNLIVISQLSFGQNDTTNVWMLNPKEILINIGKSVTLLFLRHTH